MTIKLFVIGKIKEQYLKLGLQEYVSRITPYCKLDIIEVNDEPVKDNPSLAEIEIVKNKEADKILKLLKTSDYLISLDLNKKERISVLLK